MYFNSHTRFFNMRISKSGAEAQLFLNKTTILTLSRGVDQYILAFKWCEQTNLRFAKNNFEYRP